MSPDEDKKPQEPVGGDLPLFEGEQHGYYDEEGNYHGTYRGGYIQQVPSEAR
jgi:hypothetical protein